MHEHEYKAGDKTVTKMGRSGLEEENLKSGESVRVSRREQDSFLLQGKAGDSIVFQREKAALRKEDGVCKNRHAKRKQLYGKTAGKKTQRQPVQSAEENKEPEPAEDKMSGLPLSFTLEEETAGPQSNFMPEPETRQLPDGSRPENSGRTGRFSSEDAEGEVSEAGQAGILSGHSSYYGSIREHPSRGQVMAESAAAARHRQKKKQLHRQSAKEGEKPDGIAVSTERSESKNTICLDREDAIKSTDSANMDAKRRGKLGCMRDSGEKKASRLSFGKNENGMVRGAGMGITKKAASAASRAASGYMHWKGHEEGQDNAALEGAYQAESAAEHSLRYAVRASSSRIQKKFSRRQETAAETVPGRRLQFDIPQGTAGNGGKQPVEADYVKKNAMKRFWQKQRIKKSYQGAKYGGKTAAETAKAAQTVSDQIKSRASAVFKSNKWILGAAAVLGLLFLMLSSGLSSCSTMMEGISSSIIGSTYPGTDEDIHAAEDAYAALEDALDSQINSMESAHPGFDEYLYQVDEISHNPYQLASYFTAKYGGFTFAQAADELEEIFREQYSLSVDEVKDTVTETKTVRVGESLGQVVTSGYCSCPVCCGIWSGGPTASGAYPAANHTIAVDASHPFVPVGTKVVMNGVEYVVEDTGAFASYGVQFDVYYGDHASASAHGHQTWEAYISDGNGSREVEVTVSEDVNRLEVTLTNHGLDNVLRSRMNADEEKRYDLYNATYGNRDYLFNTESLPAGTDGSGYEIPAEALSDEKFARMIQEAEKYLGFPYVWGGASPDTSFDCSGFVSWVINNCGNGWNVGRQTAEGLRGCCAYVPPEEAEPGDLIFFQGTYATSGASHVGIYAGNHMMLHCGSPVQYTNISSNYWEQHFMSFGRIR